MASDKYTREIDKGYKQFMRDLKKIKGSYVDVGIFGGGAPGGRSILKRAVANEFGTDDGHVPMRSFIRSTADKNRERYNKILARGANEISVGESHPRQVLKRVGIAVEGDTKQTITDLRSPSNAPATVIRKGSSNPLIDQGDMRSNVTHRVVLK